MPDRPPRHKSHRIDALTKRLFDQLDVLEAVPGPQRSLPMDAAARGAARRLLAEVRELVPVPRHMRRAPLYRGDLLASILQSLLAIKAFKAQETPPRRAKGHGTYPRGSERGYDA